MQDTGHVLFDNYGCGAERRRILDEQIKSGERSFRDVSEEMWASLNVPFDNGFEILEETLQIDPDFREFHQFCTDNDIPFNVISAGLKPVLRKVLDTFLGEEDSSRIGIVANDASIDGAQWKPIWRHDSEVGHDKALSVNEARIQARADCEEGEVPLIVFIGDGVSDLPAAREADVLFARRGLRLEEYCKEHNIPYIGFDTFADIKREVQAILAEDQEKTHGVGKPLRFNPRANMWRRVSSKQAVCIFPPCHAFCSVLKLLMTSNNRFLDLSPWRRPRRSACFSGQRHFPSISQNSTRILRPQIRRAQRRVRIHRISFRAFFFVRLVFVLFFLDIRTRVIYALCNRS
jgi:2,3-diketo-5-methylthio-1-phosphopentane phosphatase